MLSPYYSGIQLCPLHYLIFLQPDFLSRVDGSLSLVADPHIKEFEKNSWWSKCNNFESKGCFYDSEVSISILSRSCALIWLARGQRQWAVARKWQSVRTGQNQRLLSDKVTNMVCDLYWYFYQRFTVTWSIQTLPQVQRFDPHKDQRSNFLTLTPSIHGCWKKKKKLQCQFSVLAASKSRICSGDRSVLVQIKYLSFQEFKILQWTNLIQL